MKLESLCQLPNAHCQLEYLLDQRLYHVTAASRIGVGNDADFYREIFYAQLKAETLVADVNLLSDRLVGLNEQIAQVEAVSGTIANDLRDQRGVALRALAERVEITARENAQCQFDRSVSASSSSPAMANATKLAKMRGGDLDENELTASYTLAKLHLVCARELPKGK